MDNQNNPNQNYSNQNNPSQFSPDKYYQGQNYQAPNYQNQNYQEQNYQEQNYQSQNYQGQNYQNPNYQDINQYQNQFPNQNQFQGMQGQYDQKPVYISDEDDHKANILCVISLCCMFVVPLITTGIIALVGDASFDETLSSFAGSVATTITGLANLAAWVIMIIVRVKYRHNTFGKVLMIVYLVLLALLVIACIILFVTCINCIRSCPG